MSLIFTESFFAFAKYNGSDAFDPGVGGGAAARAAYKDNLSRAGYEVKVAANTDAATSGGFVVRTDPVYPARTVLAHSSDAPANVDVGVSAAFRKRIPITDKQVYVGFSLFVPANYVANQINSTVPVFRMNASPLADTDWTSSVAGTPQDSKEAMRITNDLSIRWGTDAAQSSRKLKPGAMNYIEVRFSPGEVSVWIDDTFVMQKAVALLPETVSWIFENNQNSGPGGTNMSGTPGRWALGNMYILFADGQAPAVRLGPTTRVIGSRPTDDVDVHFLRPVDAPTNASVAAQDLVDAPPRQLQSTVVGDFDTYLSLQNAGDIQTMGMVHAVATKVLAQNLEPDAHSVLPYLKYGDSVEATDLGVRDLVLLDKLPFAGRNIRCMGIRKGDNSIWLAGDGEMVYRSGPNQDITSWSKIRETGAAVTYEFMTMNDDGSILLTATGTKSAYVLPGSDIVVPHTGPAANDPGPWIQAMDNSRYINFTEYVSTQTTNTVFVVPNPFIASPSGSLLSVPTSTSGPQTNGFQGALRVTPLGITMALPKNPTGYVVLMTGSGAANANYVGRDTGDAQFWNTITWDGLAWLIGSQSNDPALGGAPRIRRSTDTSSWTPATPVGSNVAGANGYLRCAASNIVTHQSVMGGENGAVLMTSDGINWRQLPRLTTQHLYGAVALDNGSFLLGGIGGVLVYFRPATKATTLQPLAGYTMAFGSAALNPQTGLPWTPTEAASANFGVRLSS